MKSRFFTALFAAAFLAAPSAQAQIVINEIMNNPFAVSDTLGEYFELHNPTGADIDIDGWTISDNGSDSHLIANGGPLNVPAGGYLVLGRSTDSAVNGGMTVDYQYSGFFLGNNDDEIILTDDSSVEIDRVEYDGGPNFPDPIGASMELTDPALDNNVGANWAEATQSFGGGDLGTPGAVNGPGDPDTDPPVLVGLDPADEATDIPITTTLALTFDETVAAGTGNLVIKLGSNDSIVDTIDITTASFAGTTVTATPSASLANSTAYYVQLDAGAVTDTTGNPFAGIIDATTWNFTTAAPDTAAPTIVTLSPADDASGVSPATNLVITFDEDVQLGISGDLIIKKLSDDSIVETVSLFNDSMITGSELDVNPTLLLDYATGYYVELESGAVEDLFGNPFGGISGNSTWNFTTQDAPTPADVVISQYYEGSSYNKYIEIRNVSGAAITLDNYVLALFTNASAENWKTADHLASSITNTLDLAGVTLQDGEYYLIMHPDAVSPNYAATGANDSSLIADFNGNDSVVLYLDQNADGNLEVTEIADALSFTSTGEGENTSFYRLSNDIGYDLSIGSSILDYEDGTTGPWAQIDTATVDATSDQNDPITLQFQPASNAPVLDTFLLAGDALDTAIQGVTLDLTTSGGNPDEYQVSEDPGFAGATWLTYTTKLTYQLSAGPGTKTVYVKLRNASDESSALSDTIDLGTFTYVGDLVFTQYHKRGVSNNKYVEITNTGASAVDLTDYYIGRYTNADTEDWKFTGTAQPTLIALSGAGTLAAGQTMIVANTSAVTPRDAGTLTPPDLASGNITHNGNDSYALYLDADQDGSVNPDELLDALSFTDAGNEGADIGFVRNPTDTGQGFDFTSGTSILDHASIWSPVDIATVDAAVVTDNEYLGTYPGGIPSSDYLAWIGGYDVGGQTAFGDDPDSDGATNGEEWYYFASDPSVAEAHGSPVSVATAAGAGTFTFTHRRPVSRNGVTETYQWSTDLAAWTASGAASGGLTVTLTPGVGTPDVAGYEIVTVTVEITAGTPPAVLFGRLELVAP